MRVTLSSAKFEMIWVAVDEAFESLIGVQVPRFYFVSKVAGAQRAEESKGVADGFSAMHEEFGL